MTLHARQAGSWKDVGSLLVRSGGDWRTCQQAYVRHNGVWSLFYQNDVAVTVGNRTDLVLKTLFSAEDWANPVKTKRVIIPAGVEIGATQNTYAVAATVSNDGQAGSWAGTLILEIAGTISGKGGAPNGGWGGDALWMNFPGRAGQAMVLRNGGVIQGGGGAGGRGADGGGGFWDEGYTHQEGPFYNPQPQGYEIITGDGVTTLVITSFNDAWVNSTAGTWSDVWLGRNRLSDADGVGGRQIGDWFYTRGNQRQVISDYRRPGYAENQRVIVYGHEYYRSQPRSTRHLTGGGQGGDGGRGQGYGQSQAGGASGGGGGTNAGNGGSGGAGGGYGQSGAQGNAGGAGNNGGPSSRGSGGLAGLAINGSQFVTIEQAGTLRGR